MDRWTGVPHEASFQICLKLLYKDFAFHDRLHGRTPGNPRLPHFQRFMKIESKNYQRVWEIEALVWSTSPLCTLWAFTVGSGAERTRTDISADLEDRGVACTAGSKGSSLLPALAGCLVISGLDYFPELSRIQASMQLSSHQLDPLYFHCSAFGVSPPSSDPSLPYRASPC